MKRSAEERVEWAAYMRAYRKRRGESFRKWRRDYIKQYRRGPRAEELRQQRIEYARKYRARKKAEMAALRSRVAALEGKNGGAK